MISKMWRLGAEGPLQSLHARTLQITLTATVSFHSSELVRHDAEEIIVPSHVAIKI